jgi:hypothetical protein
LLDCLVEWLERENPRSNRVVKHASEYLAKERRERRDKRTEVNDLD